MSEDNKSFPKSVLEFCSNQYPYFSLIVVILIGIFSLFKYISNNYKLYNQLKESVILKNIYTENITQISVDLNSSEDVLLLNEPTFVEIKVTKNKDGTNKIILYCKENSLP